MNPVFLFLTFVAAVRPMSDADVQQRYMRVHHVWQDLHLAAARDEKSISSFLVIDPDRSEFRVETNGTIDVNNVEGLPRGFKWSAYVVTARGISPIQFPIRLKSPRREASSDSDVEQIWVIGAQKDRRWQFDISGTKEGHTFHIGSGNGIPKYVITVPEIDARPDQDPPTASILDVETPPERKWSDRIVTEWYSIEIQRMNRR